MMCDLSKISVDQSKMPKAILYQIIEEKRSKSSANWGQEEEEVCC